MWAPLRIEPERTFREAITLGLTNFLRSIRPAVARKFPPKPGA
jgi:hypothetical protein